MRKFGSSLLVVALALAATPVLSGCNTGLLGCSDGSQPFIKLQTPLAVGVQQVPTELPRTQQTAVYAAPVQAVAVAPQPVYAAAPAAACAPAPQYGLLRPQLNK